jgi:predicted DNA-binding transcriptional regulator AlpA
MEHAKLCDQNDPFLRLADLSRHLSLSRRALREALRRDGVATYTLSESRTASIRYRRSDIEAWLQRCKMRQKSYEDGTGPPDEKIA